MPSHVRSVRLIMLVLVTMLVASGCTIRFGSSSASRGPDGGVWRSADGGENWRQVIAVPTTNGKTATIANVGISDLTIDPTDAETLYLATPKNGIIYTNDAGLAWQQFRELTKEAIRSVIVDPQSPCTVYALSGTRLYGTRTCGRVWSVLYYHQTPEAMLTSIAIGSSTSPVVLMGTSAGEILRSTTGGETWDTVYRFDHRSRVVNVVADPRALATFYVGSDKEGIVKTTDGGQTWASLGAGLESYINNNDYRELIADPATPGGLLLILKYGMVRSQDGGVSWQRIDILPAPKDTTIYAASVNPRDSDEIYYVTRTSLVKTTDSGLTWSSQKLPTSRLVTDIIVSPATGSPIYFSTIKAD